MSLYTIFRNAIFALSRITTPIALVLTVICFILAWTGFSVPDWLTFNTVNSYQRKFGLWTTCIQSITFYSNGYSCIMWTQSTEPLPDFLRTTQAMITLGTIFITFALGFGLLSSFAKCAKIGFLKFLPILASLCCLVALVFVIIGLAVFGGDYPNYVSNVSGTAVNRRWGYWLFVPISIFLPFAALFFPFNYIYTNYISNRMFHAVGFNKGVTIPVPNFLPNEKFFPTSSYSAMEFTPRGSSEAKELRQGEHGQNRHSSGLFAESAVTFSTNTEHTNVGDVSMQGEDDFFDSRLNGRYLDSVTNNVAHYTEDSVVISTNAGSNIRQQSGTSDDEPRWAWQRR